jgi:hypothetical protein
MIYVQTILKPIESLVSEVKNEHEEIEIIQTDFDVAVEDFLNNLASEQKIVLSVTFTSNKDNLIAVILYADNTTITVPKL